MWDHTVFHVVASCRANPAMVAPSKRNCRIAQRIARTLGSVLGGVYRTVLLDERRDLSGAFSAYPASYCAIGYAPGPRPKARRSPRVSVRLCTGTDLQVCGEPVGVGHG